MSGTVLGHYMHNKSMHKMFYFDKLIFSKLSLFKQLIVKINFV